jgi:hypothetical protein
MSERPDQRTHEEGGPEEALSELDSLRDAGDVAGLLALAKAHRTGDGADKDLRACLRAYEVAAELGDAEAHNAVALFYLAGGVVPQDVKKGVTHLRTAADAGHAAARVYIGNLYELGVHYGKDSQKADVWYRTVARGANLGTPEAPVDSPAFDRAMAELGCVRHLLRLRAAGLPEADDQVLTRKAMQLGLRLATRQGSDPGERVSVFGDAQSMSPKPPGSSAAGAKTTGKTAPGGGPEADDAAREKLQKLDKDIKVKPRSRFTLADGAAGVGYTFLFFAFAAGAGYALTQGAHVLLQTRQALPLLGTRTHLILPIALAVFGVLPTFLVYRASSVFRALLGAAAAFGIGWAVWGTGSGAFIHDRMQQSMAAAVAGFLASLFVVGILGGTKKTDPKAKL